MDPADLDAINARLDREADLREKLREEITTLDRRARTTAGLLNSIHSTPAARLPALLARARPHLDSIKHSTAAIAGLVPESQLWRWKDMWAHGLRTAVYAAALVAFLEGEGGVIGLGRVCEVLGVREEWAGRFEVTAEDYLHGLITLVNELSRLAVNAVTLGDYATPLRISVFVKDLFAGFSMLNLKNDTLRRRFDSLKYDIKKIEEVVYDVSLRNLVPTSSSAATATSPSAARPPPQGISADTTVGV